MAIDWVPFIVSFVEFFGLYVAISLSLNLEYGYTGVPNFGKVLFVAGGAALAGSLSGRMAAWLLSVDTKGDFIIFNAEIVGQIDNILASDPVFVVELVVVSLIIAAMIGALLGYVVSYPAIRLREDYLGMLMLGAAQFFQIFLRAYRPLIGGTQGILVPDPYFYWSQAGVGQRDIVAAIVMGVFALAVFLYVERLGRSPLGRTLKAVRDSEDAARSLGKNDVAMRRNVLVMASAISGMAGALFTFYSGSVGADTWTRFAWTFWPWLIVIIGGAGNNLGVTLGAFFFAIVSKGLLQIQPVLAPFVPFDVNWLQYLLFAGLLVGILLVRPQGIIPEKPTPTLGRGYLARLARGGTASPGPPGRVKRLLARLLGRKASSSP